MKYDDDPTVDYFQGGIVPSLGKMETPWRREHSRFRPSSTKNRKKDKVAKKKKGGARVGGAGTGVGHSAEDGPPTGLEEETEEVQNDLSGEVTYKHRIPRILHQTSKGVDPPKAAQRYILTYLHANPTWSYVYYSNEDCLAFVTEHFSEYLDAYQGLPSAVERADFFRYMVILHYGGAYADIDTEPRVPLDDMIGPDDSMVVGIEAEFPNWDITMNRGYARPLQINQWFFMAAPGHPALRELCDRIHATWKRDQLRTEPVTPHRMLQVFERTGPGVWTDVILDHALRQSDSGTRGDEARAWPVRLLPRVAMGARPGEDHIERHPPGVMIQHHFAGLWKAPLQQIDWKGLIDPKMWVHAVDHALHTHRNGNGSEHLSLYPVGTAGGHANNVVVGPADMLYFGVQPDQWRPLTPADRALAPQTQIHAIPTSVALTTAKTLAGGGVTRFDVMSRLVQHGEVMEGVDIGYVLKTWGRWEPAAFGGRRHRSPSLALVLTLALSRYAAGHNFAPEEVRP